MSKSGLYECTLVAKDLAVLGNQRCPEVFEMFPRHRLSHSDCYLLHLLLYDLDIAEGHPLFFQEYSRLLPWLFSSRNGPDFPPAQTA